MFIADVTHEDIISQEDSLEYYLGDLPGWEKKIDNAKQIVLSMLKNSGKKIRKLNTPLYFENADTDTTITNTGDFTSEETGYDNVERFRFVFELTALGTGSVTVKLQGNDDPTIDDWETIDTKAYDQIGEYSLRIMFPFKQYRIVLAGSVSRTFRSYLVEDVFFLPVLFKTIELIFLSLQSEPNSNWENKYREYKELFNQAFQSLVYSYDESDDNIISDDEAEKHTQIRILR